MPKSTVLSLLKAGSNGYFLATETDGKYVRKQGYIATAIIFVVMSLLACLGFFVAWQTFVFLEAIVIISCTATLIIKKKDNHSYALSFEGDKLYILNKTNSSLYEVYDIPASDFIINQTKKEKEIDYCSVAIKNTIFHFGGVEKCKELKEYISNNYK